MVLSIARTDLVEYPVVTDDVKEERASFGWIAGLDAREVSILGRSIGVRRLVDDIPRQVQKGREKVMVERLGLLCESSMQNFLLVKVRPARSSGGEFPRRQKELKVHGDDFPGEWKLSNPTDGD